MYLGNIVVLEYFCIVFFFLFSPPVTRMSTYFCGGVDIRVIPYFLVEFTSSKYPRNCDIRPSKFSLASYYN